MKKLILLVMLVGSLVSSAVASDDISSYLIGKYMSVQKATKELEKNGFEVVASYRINKKAKGETIIFTNKELKKIASKEGRGFAGVLRVLIDEERKQISVMNPLYFHKAFLQKDYDKVVAKMTKQAIESTFGKLVGSKDALDEDDISDYHFMMGMPYYEDSEVVGEGQTSDLLKKIAMFKNGKNYIFEVKLSDTSYLVGCQLSRRTSKFVKKIGTQNAQVLPYMILIENNKATILNAKYYLAISYPSLSMGQFMKISTVPDAVLRELKAPFKFTTPKI